MKFAEELMVILIYNFLKYYLLYLSIFNFQEDDEEPDQEKNNDEDKNSD